MINRHSEAFFNLKAVVRQTGIKPDTLRAWERRYGLPTPARSPGGHRLYSQRDIDTIKWLAARQREGLSIKRAVSLWQQIEAGGQDPLQEGAPGITRAEQVPVPHLAGQTLGQMRGAWLEACLAYDEQRAEQIVNQAFALYPPEAVAVDLLQKAVAQVGEGWYEGEVTVQQEHFCSGLIIRRLEALLMASPLPTRPGRILFACPPQELHIIGPLLLTFLLRRRGWEVVYLGANVPVEDLETMVGATRPWLVILAAQQLHTAATLKEMADVLYRENVPVAYGGLIFNLLPALKERIAGHFLGDQIDDAVQVIESIMGAPAPVAAEQGISEEHRQAFEHFRERQSFVESRVMRAEDLSLAFNHQGVAMHELGLNMGAALSLGDMDYLGSDLEWLKGLLDSRQVPSSALEEFLRIYQQAVVEELDERGKPIVDWLAEFLRGDPGG